MAKATVGKYEASKKAFEFLQKHAAARTTFHVDELAKCAGWEPLTVTTYVKKHWRNLLEERGKKTYAVKLELLRMTVQEFLKHNSQNRAVYQDYARQKCEELVTYEFLLPLTREDALRRSLDDLFYSDTIERRLREIGAAELAHVFPRVDLTETVGAHQKARKSDHPGRGGVKLAPAAEAV